MLNKVLKKVKNIDLATNNKINSLFVGNYRSIFYGKGIEFADLRKYEIGDDIRDIDWNSTSRNNEVMVKQYHETRDNTLFFIFDMSQSMQFYSGNKKKYETLLETFSILAFAAVRNGDKVGAMFSGSGKMKIFKPKKGKNNVLMILSEAILKYEESEEKEFETKKSVLDDFKKMMNILKHSSTIFWLTGYIPDKIDYEFKKNIKSIKSKNDLIPIIFLDKEEVEISVRGVVEFADSFTGEVSSIFITDEIAEIFEKENLEKKENFLKFFRKHRIESVFMNDTENVFKNLLIFFKKRQRHII